MLCLAPVLRQIWRKKEIFEKIAIDNQQVTDGGRALLNPASATKNGRISFTQRDFDHYQLYSVAETHSDSSSDASCLITLVA